MADLTIDDLRTKRDQGSITRLSVTHKFGRNTAVSTTFVPIAMGGLYRTPQVGSATALRVKAGNANDTAAGSGAREVTVQGLDETGAVAQESLVTNGASAGTAGSVTFMRVFRAWVSASGTYATQTTGSHAAAVVVENAAGTEDWVTIDATNYPKGQSEIAFYSVPLGWKAYVGSITIGVDTNQAANVAMFQRSGILETAAPYQAMREKLNFGGVVGQLSVEAETLVGPYPELTDLGFMARTTSGTADVDIDFEIILVRGGG